jgi:hypothetical protein
MLPEHPKRVSRVLQQRVHPRKSAASTLQFFRLDEAAETHECLSSRSLRRHARAQIVVGVQLQVTLQLVRKVAIVMRPRQERRPTLEPRA